MPTISQTEITSYFNSASRSNSVKTRKLTKGYDITITVLFLEIAPTYKSIFLLLQNSRSRKVGNSPTSSSQSVLKAIHTMWCKHSRSKILQSTYVLIYYEISTQNKCSTAFAIMMGLKIISFRHWNTEVP